MPAGPRTGACRRGCVGALVTKDKLEHLVRCIDALTVERDIDGVARALCDALRSAVNARRCAIYVAAGGNGGGSSPPRGGAGGRGRPPGPPPPPRTASRSGGGGGSPLPPG